MELSVVKPGNEVGGTVAVSDTNFAREYNEALVHQVVTAFLADAGRERERKRLAQKWRVVVKSHGVKRARDGQGQAPSAHLSGAPVG